MSSGGTPGTSRVWPIGLAILLAVAAAAPLVYLTARSRPGREARWRAIEAAVTAGRWGEAAGALDAWLVRDPGDTKARLLQGAALVRLGRNGRARGVLEA